MLQLSEAAIHAGKALQEFEYRAEGAGGIVSFSGQVRPNSKSGSVSALHLQAYSPMTERGIESAIDKAQRNWPLIAVDVRHRIGEIKAGETIVFVAAASAHRRAAFEAADFLMDYLKTEAIFWKQEKRDTETVWIEPRGDDYTDNARWADLKDR